MIPSMDPKQMANLMKQMGISFFAGAKNLGKNKSARIEVVC